MDGGQLWAGGEEQGPTVLEQESIQEGHDHRGNRADQSCAQGLQQAETGQDGHASLVFPGGIGDPQSDLAGNPKRVSRLRGS